MAEDKNITLHPTSETGAIDPSVNLYPKTKPGNILELDNYLKTYIREAFFPIGSIYVSTSSTFDPELKFGGRWRAIEGKFLAGIGQSTDAEGHSYSIASGTGGFADAVLINHVHTTETSEAGLHSHTFTGSAVNTGDNNQGHTHSIPDHNHAYSWEVSSSGSHTHTVDSNDNLTGSLYGGTLYFDGSTDKTNGIITTSKKSDNYGGGYDTSKMGTFSVNANHAHTLSGEGLHSHSYSGNTNDKTGLTTNSENQAHTHSVTAAGTISGNGLHTHTITMQNPANGINSGEDRNIPPYQGVYIWERYE